MYIPEVHTLLSAPPPFTPMREEDIKTNFILGKDFKGLKGKESKKGKDRQKKKKTEKR